ncbi:MAG: ATP-binding protein [Defluviitaleaceae bacterium]|nr:ATP-binding protein [Defluviitaleaceae bacterium]MCL2261791.1 ATP-binding protein [Defluviitaleaceae bacterium]
MKQRLFIYTTLIILAGLLAFLGVSVFTMDRNNLSLGKNTVVEITRIIAGLYAEGEDLDALVSVGRDTRITIISSEGVVLADSRPYEGAVGQTRLDRPEIEAAARGTPMVSVRHSTTHNIDFIYYALQVPTGDGHIFIRAAKPVAQVDVYLRQSVPWLFVTLLILAVICFFVVRNVANRTIEPFNSIENNLRLLAQGDYKPNPIAHSYYEIDKITKEIDGISSLLQENYNALKGEKNKLTYILNSIGSGLFVVDEKLNLTLVNIAAGSIFSASPDVTGKKLNYLVPDNTLVDLITDCVKSARNTLFEFDFEGKIYLVTLKWLPDTDLTMVALADITESRESAKRREEFFANASHELKTPLTAIRGFNELADTENKDENLKKYIDGISRETNRMMSLISDMLKLSELENTDEKNPAPVSLDAVINEVKETCMPVINEKSIIFEVQGNAKVLSEPKHMYEIVKNLIENAIRYNSEGGKVTVKIEERNKSIQLSVTDNGIGISPAEQAKIFERFYRVEKSRSAEGGGTGLGLAIVKHICALYNWKLSLKSKLGVGTTVTVEF